MTSSTRTVFLSRLSSTVVLWTLALFTIFKGWEIGFFVLVGGLGLLALWEFYRMLDNKNLPNFKVIAMICGLLFIIGSFYFFSRAKDPQSWRQSYDFEVAVVLFFLLIIFARQMFERTRHYSPLEAMAYTTFGFLYVLWLFNFVTKLIYVFPRDGTGHVIGHFYVLYFVVITKLSVMGAYL